MKVLHLNSFDLRGGSETVFNVTRANGFVDHNISAYIPRNKSNKESAVEFEAWDNYGKIKGAFKYIYSAQNYLRLKSFLGENKFDIIHFHDIYSALSPSVLRAMKEPKINQGAKIVQTVHDYHLICPNACLYNYSKGRICEICVGKKRKFNIIWNNCDRRGIIFSLIKALRGYAGNNIFRQTDIVDLYISPSGFLMKKMVEGGINKEKIVLLPNPMKQVEKAKHTAKENIVCYFGRLSGDKNVSFLLNSFLLWKQRSANDFKLVIIGEGEEEENLKEKAQSSEFKSDIIFKPFLPHNLLMAEISKAKYFSMSSIWYENAPMVILEAFANGLIPIVPGQGGMEESIGIINCGRTYEPGNADSWVNAITEIEESYMNEYSRLLDNQSIITSYEIENYHKKLLELYHYITGTESKNL